MGVQIGGGVHVSDAFQAIVGFRTHSDMGMGVVRQNFSSEAVVFRQWQRETSMREIGTRITDGEGSEA